MEIEKFIKINNDNFIVDVFFENQKNKFDGTEISIGKFPTRDFKIFDKYISDEEGNFIYKFIDKNIIELTIDEIYTGNILNKYKIKKRDELKTTILQEWPNVDKTMAQIKAQWNTFKTNVVAATTKTEVDAFFDNAYAWLGL